MNEAIAAIIPNINLLAMIGNQYCSSNNLINRTMLLIPNYIPLTYNCSFSNGFYSCLKLQT